MKLCAKVCLVAWIKVLINEPVDCVKAAFLVYISFLLKMNSIMIWSYIVASCAECCERATTKICRIKSIKFLLFERGNEVFPEIDELSTC